MNGLIMGTTFEVTLNQQLSQSQFESLSKSVSKRLNTINGRMSTYREDSEISRFNRSQSTNWFPVSKSTAAVVTQAMEIHRFSKGAFDITASPLIDLWGFGPQGLPSSPPGDEVIQQTLKRVGSASLQARINPPALQKANRLLQLDLSGIAKGYAVDEVIALLESSGIRNALVEIGGELRAIGQKADGSPWRIGIESPAGGIYRNLTLRNEALATSGDYRAYFTTDGQQFSHLIDPRLGRPVRHKVASVSVLSCNCLEADAWATALMVLPLDQGKEIAEDLGMSVLWILKEGNGFEEIGVGKFQGE
ncbi:MAG: FAD:protein FMN transferase [Verrucomicrobiota bacterium]